MLPKCDFRFIYYGCKEIVDKKDTEEKTNMKKKNLGIICASIALCGTAIFGSYAWLTATSGDPLVNKFETKTDSANITIHLSEPSFTAEVKEAAADYIPGDKFAKDPTVKNTSAKNSLFTAIKVTYQIENANNQTMDSVTADKFNEIAKFDKINDGWIKIGQTADGTSELYMYDTALAAQDLTTALFNEVQIRKDIDTGTNKDFDIIVQAFGTQAENADEGEVITSLINLAGVEALGSI